MIDQTNTIRDASHNTLDTIASLAPLLAHAVNRLPVSEQHPWLVEELHRLGDAAITEMERRCSSTSKEDDAA